MNLESLNTLEELSQFIILQPGQSSLEATSVEVSQGEYKYWTVEHSRSLIDLYAKYKNQLGSSQLRSLKKLWELIAQNLKDIYGINVNANHVENRWRVLYRNYRKYTDNKKQTGAGRKHFEYADQMDQLFGKKKSIVPELLLTSTSIEKENAPEEENRNNESNAMEKNITDEGNAIMQKENVISSEIKDKSRKNKYFSKKNTISEKIRLDNKEYREKKLKIYEERKEIERKKLNEIKRKNDLLEKKNNLLEKLLKEKNDLSQS